MLGGRKEFRMRRSNVHGILLMLVAALVLVGCARENERKGVVREKVILPAGQVHEGWYFAAGSEVIVAGTVKGDAYVAGGMVQIDGTIEGDLLVAGGSVVVNGNVLEDVRAAGGTVEFNGTVGKNVTAGGGSVRLGKAGTIGGGLLAAGGSVIVSGNVTHDVRAGSEEMTVTGAIGGDCDFGGESLTVTEGAKVGGNLHAWVGDTSKVQIAPGTVMGTTQVSLETEEAMRAPTGPTFGVFGNILWILSILATALVVALLFPGVVNGVGTALLKKPGMSILWGVLAFIVTPIAAILLMITVIGIPLALLLLTVYLWLLYLTQLTFGILLGQVVFKSSGKTGWQLYWPLAVALIVVELVVLIPYVGFLVRLFAILFGMGALLMVWRDLWKRPRK
jgi:hypothetical protein